MPLPRTSEFPAGRRAHRGLLWGPPLLMALLLSACGCQWLSQARLGRDDAVRRLAEQAERAERQNDWARAADLWSRAARKDPADARLLQRSAVASLECGDRMQALRQFRQAVAARPNDAPTLVELARLAFRLDETEQGNLLIGRAVEIEPTNVDALSLQAEWLQRSGSRREAMAAYHRVLAVEPENVNARLRLAQNLIDTRHSDRAAVLLRGVCHCALASDDDKAQARRQLGLAYAREGRWKDAAAEFQRAVDAQQRPSADDLRQLALAYQRSGDDRRAKRVLQRLRLRSAAENRQAFLHDAPSRTDDLDW